MTDMQEPQKPENVPHLTGEQHASSLYSTNIFRNDALKRLSIPDELDKLFIPISVKTWIFFAVFALFALMALIWLFAGSIPIIAVGPGITINEMGLFSIESKTEGFIEHLFIKRGQEVKKGDLIGTIYDFQGLIKYQNSLAVVKDLENDVNKLTEQIHRENVSRIESLQNQIEATEASIKDLEEGIPPLESELKTKEELYREHLISLTEILQAREQLSQQQIALATAKGTLASQHSELVRTYRLEELENKKKALLNALQESRILKDALEFNKLYAPHTGRVLEILKSPGQYVMPGTPLVRLEYLTGNTPSIVIYAYIPIEFGKRIKVGSQAFFNPFNVDAGEYGSMLGKITDVTSYPVSKNNVEATIQNSGLVDYFLLDPSTHMLRTVVQVTIKPEKDPNTPSGYKWTSAEGPRLQIPTGTVGTVKIVVERVKPIYYFVPLWKFTFGYQSENPEPKPEEAKGH